MATIRQKIQWHYIDPADGRKKRVCSKNARDRLLEKHQDLALERRDYGYEAIVKQGGTVESQTFPTKKEARDWAQDKEVSRREGTWINVKKGKSTYLADIADAFVEAAEGDSGKSGDRSRARTIKRLLGRRTVGLFAAHDVLDYVRKRRTEEFRGKPVSDESIIRELTVLKSLLAIAAVTGAHHQGDPVGEAKALLDGAGSELEKSVHRERRLREGEEKTLLKAPYGTKQNSFIKDIVVLALETCARRGELAAMRWEHIDLDGRAWRIQKSKTDKVMRRRERRVGRTVALSPRAIEVLQGLGPEKSGPVFDIEPHSITTAFDRLCMAGKINDLTLHDLRHEAISRLFDKGWQIQDVAAMSGHTDWRSLRKYTHPRVEDLAVKLAEEA